MKHESGLLHQSVLHDEYPALRRCIYMDVANQGLISRTTRQSCDVHLDNQMHGRNDEPQMLQLVERTRERFAQFIGAGPEDIAITKNASEAINIIANAIEWRPGDNVVFCPKLEHANNVVPWLGVAQRKSVELRAAEPERGQVSTHAIAGMIDSRTRVVTLASATMVPGFLTNFGPIVKACRQHGAFLMADATQSVGIMHTDVAALGIDGLAVSTVKGLMGFYGLGFLYCRREWAERFMPAAIARFSVDLGAAPESAPVLGSFKLRPGAMRFDVGHYNFPAVAAAYASLGQLAAIGTMAIETKVRRLAARLASELLALGLPVCGGTPGAHIGSIVAVGDATKLDDPPTKDGAIESLCNHFLNHDVMVSVRRGLLRFSLHHYNSDADVNRVVALTKTWLERSAPRFFPTI